MAAAKAPRLSSAYFDIVPVLRKLCHSENMQMESTEVGEFDM